jgi:hypothetical protein
MKLLLEFLQSEAISGSSALQSVIYHLGEVRRRA